MKKLYSLALGLLAVLGAQAQTVTIGETSYTTFNDAVAAAVSGDVLTIHGTVELTDQKIIQNTNLTFVGADENAQLKRKENKKGMLIKSGTGCTLTFKNITISGNAVPTPGTLLESSNNGIMNIENVKLIEINQSAGYTIDQKAGGKLNINGLVVDYALSSFAMNGSAGWTIREGNDKAVTIAGTNDFCMYVEKDYLVNVSNLVDSNILIGFDPANATRFTSKRAIIRGTGDAAQIKSGMPGYALVKEGNKTNLRIELAPLAITCDGEAVEGDEFLFANGSYNFTVANAGTGIEYSYKFTEAAAQTFAEEGFTVFDPATGITVDKEGTLEISATCATMNDPKTVTRTINISSTTGIDGIVADENAPVEYYNLQGIRVENPENGIFIRRQGNKTTKVAL